MDITRNGTQASRLQPPENFTGSVRADPLFAPKPMTRANGTLVTFEPNGRTNWHTHPAGQTLIVTAGRGWVQREGEKRQDIHPGDVIWIPPGEKHWHGATSNTAMSHISIVEHLDGKSADWMEPVTDAQYTAG